MEAVKFAVEDIVQFTRDGVNLIGVVEAIDGDNYSVRIWATADDLMLPTDEVVTLSESELTPYVEEEIETLAEEELLKAIENEGKASKPLSLKSADAQGQTIVNGDFVASYRWGSLFFYKVIWTPSDADVIIVHEMYISDDVWITSGYTETISSIEVVKVERLPTDAEMQVMKENEQEARTLSALGLLESIQPVQTYEENSSIPLDTFVEYESAGGKVIGKVTDILIEGEHEGMKASEAEPVYGVEVYEQAEDGMVASGIMTYRRASEMKLCEEPKMGTMKRLPRYVSKLKKAELIEEESDSIGIIKGYLSIFGNTDLGGDVVKRGAFKRSLEHQGGKVVFMADHGYKTNEVLGVLELEEDEIGLKMTGKINRKTSQGENAYQTAKFQIEQGVPIGASIGYEPTKYNRNTAGGYDLEEVKLFEGSMTPFPMNTEALITEASKRFNRANREKRARLFQTLKR